LSAVARGEVIEDQSAEPEAELVRKISVDDFLGGMLFGRDRVPGWLHLLSALLVALPAVSANSGSAVEPLKAVVLRLAEDADYWQSRLEANAVTCRAQKAKKSFGENAPCRLRSYGTAARICFSFLRSTGFVMW
jgi:hypothetical protein